MLIKAKMRLDLRKKPPPPQTIAPPHTPTPARHRGTTHRHPGRRKNYPW